MNLLRISWQSLPDLYSRILPEGDPEAQGLRAGWGAIFDWLRTQELTTQIGIIAGMVAVGYLTYRFFFSSDGGGPGGGGVLVEMMMKVELTNLIIKIFNQLILL